MPLTLYEHPLSPYAQKCKIALREKGLEFRAVLPEGLGTGKPADAAFLAASPRGEVPALVDDALAIFDSSVILEYLEERWPEPAMLPASAAARAQVRMLEDVMDTHVEAINWGLGEVHFFARADAGLAPQLLAHAGTELKQWFAYLEAQLGAQEWFNGARFGWGDIAVIPYLNGAVGFGFEPAADSRLAAWRERVMARPAVAETAAEALATIPAMREVATWIEQGLMRREYRDHRLEWMIRAGGMAVVKAGLRDDTIRFSAPFAPSP